MIYVRCERSCNGLTSCANGLAKTCRKCGRDLGGIERVFVLVMTRGDKQVKKTLRGITLSEARLIEAQQAKARHHATPPGTRTSLERLASVYLDSLEARGAAYYPESKLFLDRLQKRFGATTQAAELTRNMVKQWQGELRREGKSPAYVDRHIAVCKAAWNYSLPDDPNPFRIKLYQPDNQVEHLLTQEQKRRLLQVAASASKRYRHMYAFIVIALMTGLRKTNILRLRPEQINFEDRTIRVWQKGGRVHEVPMNRVVEELLRATPPSPGGWYFANPQTGKPYDKDIRKAWRTLKTQAGISPDFRFHDLRHQVGTEIYRATRDLQLAKKVLGHTDIKTTLRYAHAAREEIVSAVDGLATNLATGRER